MPEPVPLGGRESTGPHGHLARALARSRTSRNAYSVAVLTTAAGVVGPAHRIHVRRRHPVAVRVPVVQQTGPRHDRAAIPSRAGQAAESASRRVTRAPRAAGPVGDLPVLPREHRRRIYFVSPTAYNILGLDDWVSSLRYVCYFDSFDGAHDHVFVPSHAGPREFETFESVNTYLLGHKEVVDRIRNGGPTTPGVERRGPGLRAVRDVRRGDGAARRGARPDDRPAAARAARADRLQDRDDAARQRGGRRRAPPTS